LTKIYKLVVIIANILFYSKILLRKSKVDFEFETITSKYLTKPLNLSEFEQDSKLLSTEAGVCFPTEISFK
jgi:hypothetical protein